MSDRYEPSSEFLKCVIAEEVPLIGSAFADANLRRLIAFTRDPDRSNRDWAALLLAQRELDTPEVRAALLHAAGDEDEYVRGEALAGLAARDPALALPLVKAALSGSGACVAVFEAAELIADAALIADLECYAEPSGDAFLDRCVLDALAACKGGVAAP